MENEKRLISAEQAYEIARLHHHDFAQSIADLTSLREVLKDCDTVDAVEVVHAEWLDGYGVCDNKKSYISIDCSNCGEYFKIPGIDEDIEEWKKRFAYCPFCGASMRDGDGNGN